MPPPPPPPPTATRCARLTIVSNAFSIIFLFKFINSLFNASRTVSHYGAGCFLVHSNLLFRVPKERSYKRLNWGIESPFFSQTWHFDKIKNTHTGQIKYQEFEQKKCNFSS